MPLDKNILKKKVFGVPVPILAVGAGVVGVIAFKKFGGGGGGSTTDDTGQSASPADYSGGSAGGGGAASDYSGGGGSVGGAYDTGYGSAGSGTYDPTGGAFLPATDAGGLAPSTIINKTVKIIRRPARNNHRRRRPVVINKTVINKRVINKTSRPNRVHRDVKPKPNYGQKPRPKAKPTATRRR